jgi:hypothetical protein
MKKKFQSMVTHERADAVASVDFIADDACPRNEVRLNVWVLVLRGWNDARHPSHAGKLALRMVIGLNGTDNTEDEMELLDSPHIEELRSGIKFRIGHA